MASDTNAANNANEESPARRSPRYCRTHALVSALFAKSSSGTASAAAWSFNAWAWAELAEMKERGLGQGRDIPPPN